MNVEQIICKLHFPEIIEQGISEKMYCYKKEIHTAAEKAYRGKNFNFELGKYPPDMRLSVIVYLLIQKYKEYRFKKIPDDIIFETFRDVALRAALYYQKTKQIGISKEDVIWFRHIMNVCIFKIGVLQYQPFQMIYLDEKIFGKPCKEYVSLRDLKMELPPGSPVINCHIQKGAHLTRNSIDFSLKSAGKLFKSVYPDTCYKAFVCYSWLLYPPMIQHLSEKSNIRQFADRFQIIGCCDDSEQAMENIRTDRETTLKKIAEEHKEWLGFAYGYIKL